MSHDIMIDLETLGTTADAAILSIGAVRFDLEQNKVFQNTFYTAVELDWQPGRRIDPATLAWWMAQDDAAKAVFTEPKKVFLSAALVHLYRWIDPEPGTPVNVWSNGADFDLPMLAHAYCSQHQPLAWAPYSARCYRTYKNLPGARAIKLERTGKHHNALDDAIYQARHLCAIHDALFGQPAQQGGAV